MDYYCAFCKRKGRNEYTTNYFNNYDEVALMPIEDNILNKKLLICEDCLQYYKGFVLNYFFVSIDDKYKSFQEEYRSEFERGIAKRVEKNKLIENEKRYKEIADKMLLSTVNGFEGYSIQEYTGIVTSNIVLGTGLLSELESQINDLFGTNSNMFEDKPMKAKEKALEKVKLIAATKGANGLIGISFDVEITNTNMFIVSVTATGVNIVKN